MKFYNIKNKQQLVDPREAVMFGMAADGGLFMPTEIPSLTENYIEHLHAMSFQEIAFEVASRFFRPEVPNSALEQIIENSIRFDAPLVEVGDDVQVLELFHGPTLSFKDFGAQFLSYMTSYFAGFEDKDVTILVATSGDTGSAVAHGFHNLEGIKVVLLYPSGKVSKLQEQQFTTLGGNVTSLEIDGSFDDCQKLAKQAFADADLRKHIMLTSANSINIARLIPQIFYYFRAYGRIQNKPGKPVFAVPSGNFGNLTSGLIAKRMGLPVGKFVAATNSNDTVPRYLKTGIYEPRRAIQTLSNAMDVGAPSNFARILELYENNLTKLRADLSGSSFSDPQTTDTIHEVFNNFDYILDPHGAVGYLGLMSYLKGESSAGGIFLATAHPAKFWDIVSPLVENKLEMPERLEAAMNKPKTSIRFGNDYDGLRNFLVGHTL